MTDRINTVLERVKDSIPGIRYELNEPMGKHTSFRIGGTVRAMFFPDSANVLVMLLSEITASDVRMLVIGNGTNLLVADALPDMVVINTAGMCAISLQGEDEIYAEAGVSLSTLALFAYEHGLTGLEFAHGIPGTVGGAIVMNAGAYGGEIGDVILSSDVFAPDKGVLTLGNADHSFSYRTSRYSNTEETILSCVVKLQNGNRGDIRTLMDEYASRRRKSQPLDIASAGSTFKRPPLGYAASLIDEAGLRGYRAGRAMVSEKHAGFVVNEGGASFSDVMAVIDHVRETVLKTAGVELEPEVRIITG